MATSMDECKSAATNWCYVCWHMKLCTANKLIKSWVLYKTSCLGLHFYHPKMTHVKLSQLFRVNGVMVCSPVIWQPHSRNCKKDSSESHQYILSPWEWHHIPRPIPVPFCFLFNLITHSWATLKLEQLQRIQKTDWESEQIPFLS